MTAIFTCSQTWRQITETSFHCVGCRHVCVDIEWCVWVSQTEIRRKPFNYPPEQGPAFSFFITTSLCCFTDLTPSSSGLHIFPSFFLPLLSSAAPQGLCPLRVLKYHFPLLISCPYCSMPSHLSHTLHIPLRLFLPTLLSENKLAAKSQITFPQL